MGGESGKEAETKEKTVIIAGSKGLIGKAVYKAFVKTGATVIGVDKRRGSDIGAELGKPGSLKKIIKNAGKIDIFINATYPKNIYAHLETFLLASLGMAEHMAVNGGGVIVNMSSIYGKMVPLPELYIDTGVSLTPVGYCTVKAGIIQMGRVLNRYYRNVRVLTVICGGVKDKQDPKFIERYEKYAPMLLPDEVAAAILKAVRSHDTKVIIDNGFINAVNKHYESTDIDIGCTVAASQ